MELLIKKIDDKLYLELPESFSKKEDLNIKIETNRIVVEKKNKETTIEERLEDYSSKNFIKKYDWGNV